MFRNFLIASLLAAASFTGQARIMYQQATRASQLAFGHQVQAHHRQPEYEHQDNAPEYEHVRPHPDLPGTPETPEQGYVGKNVIHTNFETATGDWTGEYGPSPKPPPAPSAPPPPPAPAPPAPKPPPPVKSSAHPTE